MRWLTTRTREDRGAVAALFAVLLVPLLATMAIGIDVGALYAERAQLQNGADAAALAVAADCGDQSGCSGSSAIAGQFADENALDGAAATFAPTFSGNTVTITVRTENSDGSGAMRHPLASLIGIDPTTVFATATAEWGNPNAGAVLPLALAYCEFSGVARDTLTLIQYDTNKPCKGPDGRPIPGGFGWLDQIPGQCKAYIDLDSPFAGSDPGLDPPKNCDDLFSTLEGRTVLIPIYDGSDDKNGQKGEFRIHSFAAFTVTGWKFSGSGNNIMNNPDNQAPPCTGNCRGIQGYFVDWVEVGGDWELGGPDTGIVVVRLID